jgi:predicted metal-dependent enzyme (double-stranded beta helix superfamily)
MVVLVVEDVVAGCEAALHEHTPALAVRDVLDGLVADPRALDQALGPVQHGGITTLHNSADLTILRVAWTPGMALNPHDHRMWAVIGMYGGQEDNAFYRRAAHGLEPAGGREVPAGDVLVLGDDVIHSVANSRRDFAVALPCTGATSSPASVPNGTSTPTRSDRETSTARAASSRKPTSAGAPRPDDFDRGRQCGRLRTTTVTHTNTSAAVMRRKMPLSSAWRVQNRPAGM